MKVLEISVEIEKALSQVCDFALKHAGLAAHDLISAIKAGIKDHPSSEQQ